jgi:hypothetical protein
LCILKMFELFWFRIFVQCVVSSYLSYCCPYLFILLYACFAALKNWYMQGETNRGNNNSDMKTPHTGQKSEIRTTRTSLKYTRERRNVPNDNNPIPFGMSVVMCIFFSQSTFLSYFASSAKKSYTSICWQCTCIVFILHCHTIKNNCHIV